MYSHLIIDYNKPENEIRFKVDGQLTADQLYRLNKLGWCYSIFFHNWSKEYSKEAKTELGFIFPELQN